MVYANQHEQPTTEEINLVRLVRRLEKSVANKEDWTPVDETPVEDVLLRIRKTVETVKFARRLIKTVEIEFEDTPARFKRLSEAKIQLDRIDKFLTDSQASLKPRLEKAEKVSLLASLPLPVPKQEPHEHEKQPLTIVPPDPDDDISPSLISTALPSLLPINNSSPTDTVKSSALLNPTFGPARQRQSTIAIHEELSTQLEQMARQLKRNAIHFSTSLAQDKSVISDAGEKLESNFDDMQSQRVKLRDRSRGGRSNTWMIVGIVVLVLVVFMMMVMVIRFS